MLATGMRARFFEFIEGIVEIDATALCQPQYFGRPYWKWYLRMLQASQIDIADWLGVLAYRHLKGIATVGNG